MALNCLTGNNVGIADYIVNNAQVLPSKRSRRELKTLIAKNLDDKLYKVRVNATDGQYNAALIEQLIEEYGILLPESETAFMKSQMQAQMVYKEISQVVGQPDNAWARDSAADIKQALPKQVKGAPVKAVKVFAETAYHYVFNYKTCRRILAQ